MLTMYVLVQSSAFVLGHPWSAAARRRGERGQATAEYALVLLGVAAVAVLLTGWATRNNGVRRLFDAVLDQLLSKAR